MAGRKQEPLRVTLVRARAIDPAVNKIARTLASSGYDVKLLVWDRQHTLNDRSDSMYAVCRFGLKAPYDKASVFFYLPIWWTYEFFFLLKDRCDVIHACDLDTLMPAVVAKMVKRVKLCYTIYDFYANNLPDGRFQVMRRLIRSVVAHVEKLGIGLAEVLFLVDESRFEQIKGARVNQLFYIYNSPPDLLAENLDKGSEDKTHVGMFYAGAITESRGLESVLKAIQGLDGITLTIAGTGPFKHSLERQAADAKSRACFVGWMPYEEVIGRTMQADVLFAFYDPMIPANRWASPNKLFEAMMCAKPIIVNDGTSMTDIVNDENCGLVVPYGDVAAIREAILKLKNHLSLRRRLGDNGRKAYIARYAWSIMEQRLLNAYQRL
jgi:glycosyltransferase involved in cell wall biosynthesis